jgi:hypothetical protein
VLKRAMRGSVDAKPGIARSAFAKSAARTTAGRSEG